MAQLVLVRHGQSVYNLRNLFTGELDVELTPLGEQQAHDAATRLRGFRFDVAFTSVLKRANETLRLILEDLGQTALSIHRNKALNERNYGQLQGLNKAETARRYGAEQVQQWRRSYNLVPPGGESLAQTRERAVAYYEAHIRPHLAHDQHVLVVAHGNSLRGLAMYLENLSAQQVLDLEIPTGGARVYDLTADLHIGQLRVL
ncbi:2,3-bisphosphoglycerate-dependent phosphoglycerate mutase [Hymenobacter actinosclerus]|uniref:2,3-bisphosphoglycerate-dependent phosphoglycerate mutase n=1 Tax=Hymenobacter actinosclerus TaxID=82805 RepID=A0A1I0E3Z8_9BACT|nr:2,3-diphosphoglycerate-dependent phosphoglycerate mutase [Hymenobacter actinosclerus]SET39836.1 phosphoglycerate mutase [Hymenobacter actinosclerus]